MIAALLGRRLHRHNFDVDEVLTAVGRQAHALLANGLGAPFRTGQRAADGNQQPLAEHLEQVQRRAPRRGREVGRGVAAELQNLELGRHENPGRRVAGEQHAVGLALNVIGPTSRGHRQRDRPAALERRAAECQGHGDADGRRLLEVQPMFGVFHLE